MAWQGMGSWCHSCHTQLYGPFSMPMDLCACDTPEARKARAAVPIRARAERFKLWKERQEAAEYEHFLKEDAASQAPPSNSTAQKKVRAKGSKRK